MYKNTLWDKAEEMRLKRVKPRMMDATGNRERYTRQFTFIVLILECRSILEHVLRLFQRAKILFVPCRRGE